MRSILSYGRRFLAVTVLAGLALVSACTREEMPPGTRSERATARQAGSPQLRHRVFILYAAGYNSLSSFIRQDIQDLIEGEFVPGSDWNDNVLLVFSRLKPAQSSDSTAPSLVRIRRNTQGNTVRDTLDVPGLTKTTVATSAETMRSVLSYVRDLYPDSLYGMVFSSHGSGWVPEGYYASPSTYDQEFQEGGGETIWSSPRQRRMSDGSVPYVAPPVDPDAPAVKSIGQDVVGSKSYELSLRDFRDAIPMHLNYLIMDACLMGGIEVAWELRDKVDMLGFSQTEILAEGFCYQTIARRLLTPDGGGPLEACRDYYDQYAAMSGQNQSATVSLIDCRKLGPLAAVCRKLFDAYRTELGSLNPSLVQRFFRFDRHWFYDLEDILVQAGISDTEKAELDAALEQCILYKAATPRFLSIEIKAFSGFSMYLPSNGSAFLNHYYSENIGWNSATGLVQ